MPDIIPAGSNGYELSLLYNQWIGLGDTRTQIYSGTLAQRPAANAVFAGALYRPTDVFGGRAFFVSDGTNWKIQNGTLVLAASGNPITKTGAGSVFLVSATIPAGVITSNTRVDIRFTGRLTNNGGTSNRFFRAGVGNSGVSSIQISGTTIPALLVSDSFVQCSATNSQDNGRITLLDTGVITSGFGTNAIDLSGQVDAFISVELVALAAQDVLMLDSYEITLTNY